MENKDFLEGTFDPYIGHEIVEIKENYVKSSLDVKDYHKQPMGMVHGGVIDTMAEAAISYAAYFTQEGTWWFVSGTGEKRLERVFNKHGE